MSRYWVKYSKLKDLDMKCVEVALNYYNNVDRKYVDYDIPFPTNTDYKCTFIPHKVLTGIALSPIYLPEKRGNKYHTSWYFHMSADILCDTFKDYATKKLYMTDEDDFGFCFSLITSYRGEEFDDTEKEVIDTLLELTSRLSIFTLLLACPEHIPVIETLHDQADTWFRCIYKVFSISKSDILSNTVLTNTVAVHNRSHNWIRLNFFVRIPQSFYIELADKTALVDTKTIKGADYLSLNAETWLHIVEIKLKVGITPHSNSLEQDLEIEAHSNGIKTYIVLTLHNVKHYGWRNSFRDFNICDFQQDEHEIKAIIRLSDNFHHIFDKFD